MQAELAVLTPSFGPDADLFVDLHRSVLEHTSPDTVHHVAVPDVDLGIFERFAGPRCRLWAYSELLPRRYRRMASSGWYINARKPWPPVRGWVLQQTLKISLTGRIDAAAVLIADSDVVLVRPITLNAVTMAGEPGVYRLDGAVHADMRRHVRWHQAARRMLGLDPASGPSLPDYVSPLNVWRPDIVRAMQQRIEQVTGMTWLDSFTANLHVSEFILYGVFVDSGLHGAGPPPSLDPGFCHNYWPETPLDETQARSFADQLPAQAFGMMISAKSRTSLAVRATAINRCAVLTAQG
jgi:hypothetical protein